MNDRLKRQIGQLPTSALALLAVVVAGCAGSYFLLTSHAATPTVAVEPESGTVTASTVDDATASGGRAVKFAAAASDVDEKCSQLTNLKFCDDFDGTTGTYPDSSKWNVYSSGSSWGSQCWRKTP